jgi:hypothetical protein
MLMATGGIAAAGSRAPLVSSNGVSVPATCSREVQRRTADGALLDVSLSEVRCSVRSASISLLGAPTGAWLQIGTTDIYEVGRLALSCRKSVVTSTFRLSARSASASLSVESTGSRRVRTLQPGGLVRLPSVSVDDRAQNQVISWSVLPGGEAGWTDARFTEIAQPRCRTDVRVLVNAFRTG